MSKYLNNGTYGCVMYPAIKCDGNLEKNKVSKLFAKTQFAKEEYINHIDTIEKIDPKGEFTLKLHENCPISSKYFTQLNKCSNFKKTDQAQSTQHQLLYDYGGLDLNQATKQISFEELFINMRSIFKGLVTLTKREYAHLDIKPANIVYNPTTHKMTLIDFGLVSAFKNIVSIRNNYLFSHQYPYYPPEFDLYLHYYSIKPRKNFQTLFKNKLLNLTKNHHAFLRILNNLNNDLSWRHDIDQNEIYDISFTSIRKYVDRIDIYMLGVTLLEIMVLCCKFHKTSNININSKFFKEVIELVKKMTRFSPHLRISPKEAYKEYKNIVNKISTIPESLSEPSPIKVKINYKGPMTNKECAPGKIRNIKTGRCIKDCIRNLKTGKCIKECAPGKIRNPKTGRCIKNA